MANVSGEVFILKTTNRTKGVPALLNKLGLGDYSGKQVALKANYNSADPFPASTHLDTLRGIVENLKGAGASGITLAERSGMGDTKQVLEQMGVFNLSKELGFKAVVLNDVGKEDWLKVERGRPIGQEGSTWQKYFMTQTKSVQTCCLKTHRFGGHFTLSLKNSVGLVAKKVPGGILRLHVGAAYFTTSEADDSGNKQPLQLGLCFDGWNKSVHYRRPRQGHVG